MSKLLTDLIDSSFLTRNFRDGIPENGDMIEAQSSYPSDDWLGDDVGAIIGTTHTDF